jgi:hypothetical protein
MRLGYPPRMTNTETGTITGALDEDYNLIWFTDACLDNVLHLDTYIEDAEREGDKELTELFRKAKRRKGAEQGKKLLASRRR